MDSTSQDRILPPSWRPTFGVALALVILLLSLLYALLFSHMIYDSLVEQVIAPHPHPLPRYAGTIHYHNPAEWVLLTLPALVGWLGALGSMAYLTRRWFNQGRT
jgi:hypothetical protein